MILLVGGWAGGGGSLGPESGVITKKVFSSRISESSKIFLDPLESLENGRILLCFPESEGFLESLEPLFSGIPRKWTLLKRPLSKRPNPKNTRHPKHPLRQKHGLPLEVNLRRGKSFFRLNHLTFSLTLHVMGGRESNFRGKTNKHKQFFGIVLEMGGGQIVHVLQYLNWVGVNLVIPKTYFCHFLVVVAPLVAPVVPLYCLNS